MIVPAVHTNLRGIHPLPPSPAAYCLEPSMSDQSSIARRAPRGWAAWTARALTVALIASMILPIAGAPAVMAAAPAAPPQQAAQEQAVVRPGGADLHDVPGGTVVGYIEPVSFVSLYGRDEAAEWVVVSTADGQTGWVDVKQLITYNTKSLPVMYGAAPAPSAGATQPPVTQPPATAAALPTATSVPPTATPLPPTPTSTPSPTPVPPTPTFTPVPPTATPVPPTATPRPTAAAAATAAPTRAAASATSSSSAPALSDVVAVVGIDGAELYDAPDGSAIDALSVGTAIMLTARDASGDWLRARLSDGSTGWVMADAVVAFNVAGLPVADDTMAGADAAAPTAAAPTAATTEPSATNASTAAANSAPAEEAAVQPPTASAAADAENAVTTTDVSRRSWRLTVAPRELCCSRADGSTCARSPHLIR